MNTPPIEWNCVEARTFIHIETHSPTKGEHIASVPKKQKKNARLIAASPKLLAALKGAKLALDKSLPFLPADAEAVFAGEWLSEINEVLAEAEAAS